MSEPAFPVVAPGPNEGDTHYFGMTLRDYFAAKAMAALITCGDLRDSTPEHLLAAEAYSYADRMIEHRSAT